jgi:hypothetical protein
LPPLALATSSAKRDNTDATCSCRNICRALPDDDNNAAYSRHGIYSPLPTQRFNQSLQESIG